MSSMRASDQIVGVVALTSTALIIVSLVGLFVVLYWLTGGLDD